MAQNSWTMGPIETIGCKQVFPNTSIRSESVGNAWKLYYISKIDDNCVGEHCLEQMIGLTQDEVEKLRHIVSLFLLCLIRIKVYHFYPYLCIHDPSQNSLTLSGTHVFTYIL